MENFYFQISPEYTAAIERKQVEQQIAERQRFVVEKAKQEKLATVIRIEGETEAGRLISEAMMISPEFLELRKIEASKVFAFLLRWDALTFWISFRKSPSIWPTAEMSFTSRVVVQTCYSTSLLNKLHNHIQDGNTYIKEIIMNIAFRRSSHWSSRKRTQNHIGHFDGGSCSLSW